MTTKASPPETSVFREPKFCRCRVCHAHFYGETVAEAQEACLIMPETRIRNEQGWPVGAWIDGGVKACQSCFG